MGKLSEENKICTLTMAQPELTLDIGDLEGIIQQLDAISQGFGMDFSVIEQVEGEINIEWGAKNGNFI